MTRKKRNKALIASIVVVLIVMLFVYCAVYTGKNELTNDFIKSIVIGQTTMDEVLAMDPTANTIGLSYGCRSFHVLEDGTKVYILFTYDNDRKDLFASSVDVVSSESGDSSSDSDESRH